MKEELIGITYYTGYIQHKHFREYSEGCIIRCHKNHTVRHP